MNISDASDADDRPDLEEIRARALAATDGPWGVEREGSSLVVHSYPGGDTVALVGAEDTPGANVRGDAELMAAARQDIPDLIVEVERLRAQAARLMVQRDDAEREAAWYRARLPQCACGWPSYWVVLDEQGRCTCRPRARTDAPARRPEDERLTRERDRARRDLAAAEPRSPLAAAAQVAADITRELGPGHEMRLTVAVRGAGPVVEVTHESPCYADRARLLADLARVLGVEVIPPIPGLRFATVRVADWRGTGAKVSSTVALADKEAGQ